ncbi:hypothetical protein Baya_3923 [Bagarius yarrelli]|uniref:Uncharacterized protein n=1 Tax=Bagarius yarrelli TaxID=175774 RepID=A0A556TX05_BAGYA|nr:hypothetical protein Baya_3923 [Bagarius yarrelli]
MTPNSAEKQQLPRCQRRDNRATKAGEEDDNTEKPYLIARQELWATLEQAAPDKRHNRVQEEERKRGGEEQTER